MIPHLSYRISQFIEFISWLIVNKPLGFVPNIIPIICNGKDIAVKEISRRAPLKGCCGMGWVLVKIKTYSFYHCPVCKTKKASSTAVWADLNTNEAIAWIKTGGNLGIFARKNNLLTLIDIDALKFYSQMPDTLTTFSRKRCGGHGFVFNEDLEHKIPNIATEGYGEVRSLNQYVLIPGSFVPTTEGDIKAELNEGNITQEQYNQIIKDPLLGLYTVNNARTPATIGFNELPEYFKAEHLKKKETKQTISTLPAATYESSEGTSRLFSLSLRDIFNIPAHARVRHPLHDSSTEKNFSISANGLGCCWRHMVTLNLVEYLCVKAGYCECSQAGTQFGTKRTSKLTGDKMAVFVAWREAKLLGLLPKGDKIPYSAMLAIAQKHGVINGDANKFTDGQYNKTLEILRSCY
jgi:putative DNA primase/helicase